MELSYVVLLLRAKMSLVISVTDVTDRLVPRVIGPVFFYYFSTRAIANTLKNKG